MNKNIIKLNKLRNKLRNINLSSDKKYIMTDTFIDHHLMGKLYQIKALKDFSDVKTGDLGGYIQSYQNLSQYNNCWVYSNSYVFERAIILDNAKIYDSHIWGSAVIRDNAVVKNSQIYGNVRIIESAVVESTELFGKEEIR